MLVRMLTTSTIVGLLLIPIRAKTVGFPLWATVVGWREHFATALMTGCYDIAFVAATTALFAALLLPRARAWVPPLTVYRMHLTFSVVTLIDCLSNISVVPWLGQPFNFQWLYYTDFLRSPDAMSSILATVPPWQMAILLSCTIAFVVAVIWIGAFVSRSIEARRPRRVALGVLLTVTASYLVVSFRWRYREGWSEDILVNPVWAFAESCLRALKTPSLLSAETPYGAGHFAPPPLDPTASVLPAGHPVPRNVVVFVLESVAATYVGLYGAPYGVTPVLDSQRARAAIFPRAYAHAPATNFTLVGLMTGRYPRVSFRPVTSTHPGIAVPHLSRLMREQGFATGFFSSAALEFQRADEFLAAGQGFDRIDDEDARPEAAARALEKWSEFVGTDDESTVDSLIDWAAGCGDRPFFGVMWTAQTHFPYYTPEGPRQISDQSEPFNRYLNAIAEGDRALGRLMAWLDSTGRADDTLVIVLGDHGQAFGQHKSFGHAGHTWEEHLRIPLVLINRRLFSGQTFNTLCGISDIAPTITDLLRLPDMPGYQGRSLFRTDRPNRVFFFGAWSDFLVGYREGDIKVVHNLTKDTCSVHDLAVDPDELNNIAAAMPGFTADARLRLAGWMQWVERSYVEAEAGGGNPGSGGGSR